MKSEQSGEQNYRTTLEKLDPEKLAEFLPGWKFEEEIFVYHFSDDGQRINDNTGWIFRPPQEYLFVQIEKDAKRVQIAFGNMNNVSGHGIRTVSARADQATSVVDFKSRHAHLSLTFSVNEQRVNVGLDTGRRYPNTTVLRFEIDPQSRLRIGPQTTLRELVGYL